jgi:hypothetical protein
MCREKQLEFNNFHTSLDSEKKNLTRPSLKSYMCPFKKKSWLSLAIEDNAKKNTFYGCFVALEKPYL